MSDQVLVSRSELVALSRAAGTKVGIAYSEVGSLADDPAACGHIDLIETIRSWAKAYPISVFPEPPAGEHGQTVDACSARALRHAFKVLVGMLDVAAETGDGD